MRKRNLASVAVSRVSVFNCAAMCIAGVGVTSAGFVAEAAATLRAAAGGCEPHWDNTIGQPGMDSSVRALTVFDDKSGIGPALYAGGFFQEAGGQSASRIAKWVGSGWSPVGEGVDGGWIRALAVFDDSSGGGEALYAGGYFTTAGGQPAIRIAKWDGSQWSPLGEGMSSGVLALAGFEGDSGQSGLEPGLYAGGFFTTAGGTPANYIARWDGSDWWPLGEGMNNTVDALIVFDDGSRDGPALYAGGFFTEAGGQPVNRIAKWDGSEWSPLGAGLDFGSVQALAVYDDGTGPALYAGGWFTFTDFPNGHEVSRIAKWDGSQWLPLGPLFEEGLNGNVQALTVLDDGVSAALYVGGGFTAAGGQPASRMAKWDGSHWSALGPPGADGVTGGWVDALAVYEEPVPSLAGSPAVYAGGSFHTAGGEPASQIAAWRDCPATQCESADLNCDGVVDGQDLLILLSAWGKCDDADSCPADLNEDGIVDGLDVLILLSYWG